MSQTVQPTGGGAGTWFELLFRWLWVGVPLVWGVVETAVQSRALFR